MQPILSLFELNKISLVRTATWTLSNLCRGKKPQPDWTIVSQALPTLAKLIYSMDTETLVDASWAISYLSDGPAEAIQAVVDARIPKRLVELLNHQSTLVQTPALRAVGNIVTGNDLQTQVVINCGVLGALRNLLGSPKESIRKEACWTISNITAGNTDQIQAVIDANLIPPLVKFCLLYTSVLLHPIVDEYYQEDPLYSRSSTLAESKGLMGSIPLEDPVEKNVPPLEREGRSRPPTAIRII